MRTESPGMWIYGAVPLTVSALDSTVRILIISPSYTANNNKQKISKWNKWSPLGTGSSGTIGRLTSPRGLSTCRADRPSYTLQPAADRSKLRALSVWLVRWWCATQAVVARPLVVVRCSLAADYLPYICSHFKTFLLSVFYFYIYFCWIINLVVLFYELDMLDYK